MSEDLELPHQDLRELSRVISSLEGLARTLKKYRANEISKITPRDRAELQRINLRLLVERTTVQRRKEADEATAREIYKAWIVGDTARLKAFWKNTRRISTEDLVRLGLMLDPDFGHFTNRQACREKLRNMLGISPERRVGYGWVYRPQFGQWRGPFRTKKQAMVEAVLETRETFVLARVRLCGISEFCPPGEAIIDHLSKRAVAEIGKVAYGWPDVPPAAVFDMQARMMKALEDWARRWNAQPEFFVVESEEEISRDYEFPVGFFEEVQGLEQKRLTDGGERKADEE